MWLGVRVLRRCIRAMGFWLRTRGLRRRLEERGVTFIGPSAAAIEAMGSKTRARELMAAAGVPIVPGTTEPVETVEDARRIIDESDWVSGGGEGGGWWWR